MNSTAQVSTAAAYVPTAEQLAHHGDRDVAPGLVDLAVNVRPNTPPPWLHDRLASVDLRSYPDPSPARDAVAVRHGRRPDQVLLTAGAAEAFVLIARAFTPAHAVVVHPQFTEPELAMRNAGHAVDRVVLPTPFVLDAADVPESADLVVVGNPTNPTSVLHPADVLARLARPGRLLVVDEAFADAVPGESQSLARRSDLPGVLVVRSLTKTWGLAGLRVGYVLAAPEVIARLATAQPAWAVSAPAIEACIACSTPAAVDEAARWAAAMSIERSRFVDQLAALPGVDVGPAPAAPFVLLRLPGADVRERLRKRGWAVRSGASFPGVGPQWVRVAVRDRDVCDGFVAALKECL